MAEGTIGIETELFPEIIVDSDDDNDDFEDEDDNESTSNDYLYSTSFGLKETESSPDICFNLESYIQEKYKNSITILDRTKFHQIKRPLIISFNHFHDYGHYYTHYLDRIYEASLKYGEYIEFMVADTYDIDLIFPRRNPISFFNSVKPEKESPNIYAIDEHKRICEPRINFDLMELCEKLRSGQLFQSQAIPEKSETLVQVAVHLNFEQMVTNSNRDILLIVDFGDYNPNRSIGPDYEELAEQLKDLNIDIVYIDGDKNYIPFEYRVHCYSILLFIPRNDKGNPLHYLKGEWTTNDVFKFVTNNIGPNGQSWRQKELMKYPQYKPFTLPQNATELHFKDLPSYVNKHFPKTLKVLDRNTFETCGRNTIIYFMDFLGNGVPFYLDTLNTIYQIAEARGSSGVDYVIADLQDLDVILPKWYINYNMETNTPQIFALDRNKRVYKVEEMKSALALFTYSARLLHFNDFFYSQPWSVATTLNKIKTCVGYNLEMAIERSEMDIFLTVHWDRSRSILKLLREIAKEIEDSNINIIKIDAKYNFVPLIYTYNKYPVHFFIPFLNKKQGTVRYASASGDKQEILEFIRSSISKDYL